MKPYYDEGGITIYHGDARNIASAISADIALVDPPYGETSLRWDRWQVGWPHWFSPRLRSMWCFGSLRMFYQHAQEFSPWQLAQDIVWEKHNGSNFHADRFRRVHEQVVQFYRGNWIDVYKSPQFTADATRRTVRRKERPPHTGEIADSTYMSVDGGPRLQRSVIQVRSTHGSAVHPTQKPIGILLPLIEYSCPPHGTVLDPFMGSGSTLIAARQTGRKAIGIEVAEEYCELAVQRLAQMTLAVS